LGIGVGILTAIAISFPRLIEPSGWASGEKLLYLTLVAYLAAAALHILSLALREASLAGAATALTRGGFFLHTCAVSARWVTAGYPPLSNIYEMVMVFSWGLVVAQLVVDWKLRLRFVGAITVPIAALALVLLQVLPGEIRPLVPALQSTWLQIHVTLAMLSYSGFTLAFAVALLYLVKDGVSSRAFLGWLAGLVAATYGALTLASVDSSLRLQLPAWDLESGQKIMLGPKQALLVPVPALGWPIVAVLVLAAAACLLAWVEAAPKGSGEPGVWARRLFLACLAGQALVLLLLILKVESGPYFLPEYGAAFAIHYASSPFLVTGIAVALFVSLAWHALRWKHASIVELLPAREALDGLVYRTIAVSFPLLTLMIITGAYWANRTWGSYWSWDPKEDWALITWLTYAGYLHTRLTRGWRGRRSAYFALIGFAVILFTFFGVTYLLPGLHAYV